MCHGPLHAHLSAAVEGTHHHLGVPRREPDRAVERLMERVHTTCGPAIAVRSARRAHHKALLLSTALTDAYRAGVLAAPVLCRHDEEPAPGHLASIERLALGDQIPDEGDLDRLVEVLAALLQAMRRDGHHLQQWSHVLGLNTSVGG